MDVRVQISSKIRWENITKSKLKVVKLKERRRELERVNNEWRINFIVVRNIFIDAWIIEFSINLDHFVKTFISKTVGIK